MLLLKEGSDLSWTNYRKVSRLSETINTSSGLVNINVNVVYFGNVTAWIMKVLFCLLQLH